MPVNRPSWNVGASSCSAASETRQYTLGFTHNTLLRGVVKALTDQGFVPPALAAVPKS